MHLRIQPLNDCPKRFVHCQYTIIQLDKRAKGLAAASNIERLRRLLRFDWRKVAWLTASQGSRLVREFLGDKIWVSKWPIPLAIVKQHLLICGHIILIICL